MSEGIKEDLIHNVSDTWEYKVFRVSVGTVQYQKYGPDTPDFEGTLNEYGKQGWEAFHVQSYAESEALLLFLKRRVTGHKPQPA